MREYLNALADNLVQITQLLQAQNQTILLLVDTLNSLVQQQLQAGEDAGDDTEDGTVYDLSGKRIQ